MGRALGRGAKAVGVVTHMQAKKRKNKAPKGLRGSKRHRLDARKNKSDPSNEPFKNAKSFSKEAIQRELDIHKTNFNTFSKTKKMKRLAQQLKAQRSLPRKIS